MNEANGAISSAQYGERITKEGKPLNGGNPLPFSSIIDGLDIKRGKQIPSFGHVKWPLNYNNLESLTTIINHACWFYRSCHLHGLMVKKKKKKSFLTAVCHGVAKKNNSICHRRSAHYE